MKLSPLRDKLSALCRRPPSPPCDPLTVEQVVENVPMEEAFFVSSGSLGIVDLGASLSIIGKQQFAELCESLPPHVLKTMKESACQVKFRFGNDSSVQGERAIYFPVHKYWIKVVVVPTNTPFLIANSVFRTLGAVIDTGSNTIHFKKLECTLPIQLSERRLYSLDLAELLTRCPPLEVKQAVSVDFQTVCLSSSQDSELQQPPVRENFGDNIENSENNRKGTDPYQPKPSMPCNDAETGEHLHQSTECSLESRSEDASRICVKLPSEIDSHHGSSDEPIRSVGRSSPDLDHKEQGRGGDHHHCRDHGDELRGSQEREDYIRQSPSGPNLPGHVVRDRVPDLVHSILQAQPEAGTCQVPEVPPTTCGDVGSDQGFHNRQECTQAQSQSQRQGLPGPCLSGRSTSSGRIPHARGGRGLSQLGDCSHGRECPFGDARPQRSPEQSGVHALPSGRPSEQGPECLTTVTSGNLPCAINPCIADDHQQDILLAGWSSMFESHKFWDPDDITHEGEVICYNRENNWVATEMWQYMKSQGIHTHSPKGRSIRSDLMEIYCSQDSQLTFRMIQSNGDAERFGLKQGDLSTSEGRHRLYHRLLVKQPRHLWMSPRCQAWCRWSQYNLSKSPELARRIMQDRKDDCVHLLLCDALFQFQQWRNPECHAHLEQPDGSTMVYQEELQAVLDQTYRAKCDMCVAGQLKNPITQEPLKKSTQVLTTSKQMFLMLQHLRCTQEHPHGKIEGTIRDSQLGRINLSQFTELYTRQFAQRLARSMISSGKNGETNPGVPDFVGTVLSQQEDDNHPKRRRLDDKQTPPAAYLQMYQDEKVTKVMDQAKIVAPRVGKLWLTSGPVVQAVQNLFPEHFIVAVELCKGADRRRVPHPSLKPEEAPLRITLGIHRNQSGNFIDQEWEKWSKMSRRQMIRNCHPARLLVTVFARTSMSGPSTVGKPESDTQEDDTIPCKRHKNDHPNGSHNLNSTEKISSEKDMPSEIRSFHGPAFLRLTPDQKQQLIRMHNNLGHPDAQTLGNVLKDQGWSNEAIEGIRDLYCSACHENRKPSIARPSNLPRPKEFNGLITIDGVEWTSAQGTQHYFYHILDSGTNFQIAIRSHQRDSTSVIQLIHQHWIQWAGPPQRIMTDSAGEFCSEEFAKFLQSINAQSTVIPAEAHWQMGKCERHGGILQAMLNKYQVEHPIVCDQDFDIALSQITSAKNSLSRHRGYSPEILVLGKSRHIPACVSNDPEEPADWVDATGTDPEMQWFRDNLSKRETARRAFITADRDQRLRRAYLRRSRPSRDFHQPGDLVMYWRNGKGNLHGQWHGPGQVIIQENSQVIWISHLSRLYRCAPEQIRSLSQREQESVEPQVGENPIDVLDLSSRGTGVSNIKI